MAAAPADFRAKKVAIQKIKKEKANINDQPLELSPTVDILWYERWKKMRTDRISKNNC